MKIILLCIVIILLPTIFFGQDIEVTTKDGKLVILKSNGTWVYKTTKNNETEKKSDSETASNSYINKVSSFDKNLPFNDFKASSIPFSFNGHNMTEICENLKERFISKSEFETTTNYEKRIVEAMKTPLYDRLPIDSDLTFIKTNNSYTSFSDGIQFDLRYNADKSQMLVTLKTESVLQDYKPIIGIDPSCEISFNNLEKYLSGKYRNKSLSFDFNIDAEEAKDLKENIRFFYLFNLKPPFLTYGVMNANLSEIWLFSWKSGKIAYKLKINSLKEYSQNKD